ncbi:hypothetical protein BRC86_06425, partial [Halobacteriales archaeon QS_3_64_16]
MTVPYRRLTDTALTNEVGTFRSFGRRSLPLGPGGYMTLASEPRVPLAWLASLEPTPSPNEV